MVRVSNDFVSLCKLSTVLLFNDVHSTPSTDTHIIHLTITHDQLLVPDPNEFKNRHNVCSLF